MVSITSKKKVAIIFMAKMIDSFKVNEKPIELNYYLPRKSLTLCIISKRNHPGG